MCRFRQAGAGGFVRYSDPRGGLATADPWLDHRRDEPDLRELDDFADFREPRDFDPPDEDLRVEDFFADDFDADLRDDDFLDVPEDFLADDFFPEDFLAEDFLAEDLFYGDFFDVYFFDDDFFDDDLPDEDDFDFEDFFAPLEPLRPLPDFLPPPDCLFTVAQARRSASRSETPRSS
jgi:hypothetical protein